MSGARVGVVVFPGTNCELDMLEALGALGGSPFTIWHHDTAAQVDPATIDALVLPGGFAHGDYLRPGAIARFSPVMDLVAEVAASGRPVLGICNGFQVLTEAGLLPGALQKNRGLAFVCRPVTVEVASTTSVLTGGRSVGERLEIPVNHFEGNYTVTPDDLARLEDNGQVVLRYVDNPNGSVGDVAGVCNEAGNVVGLMPHPERAYLPLLGSADGAALLGDFLAAASRAAATS